MTRDDWESGDRIVGMFLNGEEIAAPDEKGERIVDDSFLLFFNAAPRGPHLHAARGAASASAGASS